MSDSSSNPKPDPRSGEAGVPKTSTSAYALVTPVRNEQEFIGRTIASVVGQTIRPIEWIIVSDGSTDNTNAIVKAAIAENPWIRIIELPPRTAPSWTAVVDNTTLGIKSLETEAYEFLGLLDSDLEFQADYFERLIQEFQKDPKLGLAGGVAIDVGLPKTVLPRNRRDVPGALQFYRRACFEEMGGLTPIPEGGWDGVSCALARKCGWETRLVTELIVDHLKPRNVSEGHLLRRRWQMGVRDYAIGYHPIFETVKCASRVSHPPFIVGSICWWLGYCSAMIKRNRRVLSDDLVAFIREEQMKRLFKG